VSLYIVERYVPGISVEKARSWSRRIRAVAGQMAADGVRYRGSRLILEDEACLCEFEGPSADAVAAANERAEVPFARIVSAVDVGSRLEGPTSR
jgi:hypothetical protein